MFNRIVDRLEDLQATREIDGWAIIRNSTEFIFHIDSEAKCSYSMRLPSHKILPGTTEYIDTVKALDSLLLLKKCGKMDASSTGGA